MHCKMCRCDSHILAKSEGLMSCLCQKKQTNILLGVLSERDVK